MADQQDLFGGRQLREAAMYHLESTSARHRWLTSARCLAHNLAATEGRVTADDIRKLHPVPEGWDQRILGAVFNPRVKGFRLKIVDYAATKVRAGHARRIAVWAPM